MVFKVIFTAKFYYFSPKLRREQFLQWTEALPDAQSPSWLGLPNNAEKVLLTTQGNLKAFLCTLKISLRCEQALNNFPCIMPP